MRLKLLLAILLSGFVFIGSAAAKKSKKAQAKKFFHEATEQLVAGNFREAARLYKKSVELDSSLPGPYRRLGEALKALKKYEEAIQHYETYLKMRPGGKYASQVGSDIEFCKFQLSRMMGAVELTCDIEDAAVIVNDKEVGRTPIKPVGNLKPGRYVVEVIKEGFPTWKAKISVGQGQTVRLNVEFKEIAQRGGVPKKQVEKEVKVRKPTGPAPFPWQKYSWISTASLGVLAGGLGAYFGVQTGQKETELVDKAKGDITPGQYNDLYDAGESSATMANVCFAVSAVALAAAGVFFYLDLQSGQPPETPSGSVSVGVLPGFTPEGEAGGLMITADFGF